MSNEAIQIAPESPDALILQAQVAKATAYYERKGRGERVSFRDIV